MNCYMIIMKISLCFYDNFDLRAQKWVMRLDLMLGFAVGWVMGFGLSLILYKYSKKE